MSFTEKFCKKIEEAIKDEEKAVEIYEDLYEEMEGKIHELTPRIGPKDDISWRLHLFALTRKDLADLKKDEEGHKRVLEFIRERYCPLG